MSMLGFRGLVAKVEKLSVERCLRQSDVDFGSLPVVGGFREQLSIRRRVVEVGSVSLSDGGATLAERRRCTQCSRYDYRPLAAVRAAKLQT